MVGKMRTIIGNIYVVLLLNICVINAGIRLEVRSSDGIAHNSAVVGQPFLIEAIIDGVQGSVQAPQIEGLDAFVARRTGMYMSTINGVSTTKYTYQVRIDKPGNYTVGPARLMHQQKELISNVVSVSVDTDQNGSQKTQSKSSKKNDLKTFLRLKVDAERVVVGQKIKAILRFYYQDAALSLVNIGQSEIVGFDVKPNGNPIGGTEDIDGTRYKYAEWEWEMYPTKAGEFFIPAYNVDYEIASKDKQMLGGMFMFMNARPERKRVYSNAVKIKVDPLPDADMSVNAVGVFEYFVATINPPVAKEGEGMVFSLEITGSGNIQGIKMPELCMPAELKYYDSHMSIIPVPGSDAYFTKKCEFIVQGTKSGEWEIPEQSFVYFNTEKNNYVTLKTSSISVSIQPSAHKRSKSMISHHEKQKDNNVQVSSPIQPLNTQSPWYPVSQREPFSWVIFYCIMGIPVMYVGYPAFFRWLLRFAVVKRRHKKRAIRQVYKKIMVCAQSGDNVLVHAIFMELYAFLMEEPVQKLSRERIEDHLRQCGFSEEELQEWRIFFEMSVHSAYAQHDSNNIYNLHEKAVKWLKRLETVV